MKFIKAFLFYAVQFSWGILQNIAGLIGYLVLYRNHEHDRIGYSFITYVDVENFGGVSIGIFIFINAKRQDEWRHNTKIHEYGHTIQSLVLGPGYLIFVALPSVIWCGLPALIKYRKENNVSYYKLYCEGWANLWGMKWTNTDFIGEKMLSEAYFGKPLPKEKMMNPVG